MFEDFISTEAELRQLEEEQAHRYINEPYRYFEPTGKGEEFINMISANLNNVKITLRLPEWPVRTITRFLEHIPGFPLTISRINALTNRVIYPTKKIKYTLGYHPVTSLEEGIQQTVMAWKEKQ